MAKGETNKNGVWTQARIETLTELWARGLSCSLIAGKLGGGISRNAVIGKVGRLGLPSRETTESASGYLVRARRTPLVRKPNPPRIVKVIPAPDFLCTPGTFADGDVCRFIKGDPSKPGWQMCGQPGFPWCAYHRTIVFDIPRTEAKRKSAATHDARFAA